jgi:hypothetical protein
LSVNAEVFWIIFCPIFFYYYLAPWYPQQTTIFGNDKQKKVKFSFRFRSHTYPFYCGKR